jgi:glycosyltransferase involved in cell wall biosynthesis
MLSIVVPCYNEAGNIPLIIARFREIFNDEVPVEILLVNNGSTDNSKEVLNDELTKSADSRFRVVEVEVNKGYGFGILSGLRNAKGEVLAWTHADMQTDPLDLLRAFQVYTKYNDTKIFVKGERKKRSFVPWFFTFGMGLIASLALKNSLHDIGAQPKLFSREFYENHIKDNDPPYDFSLDLFVQYWAKRKGMIITFPVYFAKRQHGEAKGGGSLKTRIKVTKKVMNFIFELRIRLKSKGQL